MSSAALRLSLRGHKAAVACITQKDDFLVSADRDGWVIVWNLATKRPRAIWKAHEGHIVTLKLTAMGLLTHGRDLHIRFWVMSPESLDKCVRDLSVIGMEKDPPMPQCEEFPVNSLNFCNVDLVSLDLEAALLVTPATVDSDNFDVYKVRSNGATVLRVVENFSVKAATTSKSEVEEINSPELVLQLRGNGVIMRLLFVAQNLLFVGYESGAVFCFRIDPDMRDRTKSNDRLVVFGGYKVTLVLALSGHTPLPVLSLEYDSCRHELYCGSASKQLLRISTKRLEDLCMVAEKEPMFEEELEMAQKKPEALVSTDKLNKWGLPISGSAPKQKTASKPPAKKNATADPDLSITLAAQNQFTNLKHYGLQNIHVTVSGFVVAFWDGVIKSFTTDCEPKLVLERAEETIQALKSESIGGETKKSLCLYVYTPGDMIQGERRALSVRNRSPKEPLLFVGYGDGLIRAYKPSFV